MTQHAQDAWTYDFIQQLCICDIGTKAKETELDQKQTGNDRKTNEPSTIWSVFIKLADHANQTSLASKTWGYVH